MLSIEVYHKYTFLCDSLIAEIFKALLQNHLPSNKPLMQFKVKSLLEVYMWWPTQIFSNFYTSKPIGKMVVQ